MTTQCTVPRVRHHRTPPADLSLSIREFDVLRLMAEGLFDKQIALKLDLTAVTVSAYVGQLILKLGARSRTEAAVMAIKFKIVP